MPSQHGKHVTLFALVTSPVERILSWHGGKLRQDPRHAPTNAVECLIKIGLNRGPPILQLLHKVDVRSHQESNTVLMSLPCPKPAIIGVC